MYVWKIISESCLILYKYIPTCLRTSGISNNTRNINCLTKNENLHIIVSFGSGNSAQTPNPEVL